MSDTAIQALAGAFAGLIVGPPLWRAYVITLRWLTYWADTWNVKALMSADVRRDAERSVRLHGRVK